MKVSARGAGRVRWLRTRAHWGHLLPRSEQQRSGRGRDNDQPIDAGSGRWPRDASLSDHWIPASLRGRGERTDCGVRADATVWCWGGANALGTYGNGTTGSPVPVQTLFAP